MQLKDSSLFVRLVMPVLLASGLVACTADMGTDPTNIDAGAPQGSGGSIRGVGGNNGGSTATGGSSGSGGIGGAGGAVGLGGNPGGGAGAGGATDTGGARGTAGRTGGAGGATGMGGATSMGGTTGAGGATQPPGACTVSPVNPNATTQARNLLCYLYSQFGNHVLSGQQETSWSNPANDITYYTTNIGKAPAILGGDYLYPSGTSDRAIAYWNAGGITMIRYHMGAPPAADSYANAMGSANLDNVVKPGTAENTSFNSKLDYVATEIRKLQTANVALLWAPFHEVQSNGWFWWAKGTGPQYVALWRYMFTYLTTTKGLNNILWLLPFSGSPNSAYYPGKAFVDIAGPDTYATGQPFASNYTSARNVVGTSIPIALHETGTIPQPANMFPTAAPWLLFNVWAGFETSANTVATLRSAYASAFTVTRDEVPNLK
jgi:hypothetical protein